MFILFDTYGGLRETGGKIKEKDVYHNLKPDKEATNSNGIFTLPGRDHGEISFWRMGEEGIGSAASSGNSVVSNNINLEKRCFNYY